MAQTKYHNMIEDKTWGKVDPRDAKIIELTTKLKQLEYSCSAPIKPDAHAGTKINGWGGSTASGSSKIED